MQGDGQQRHWVRNTARICCEVTASRWSERQPTICEKQELCTYCLALTTDAADSANGVTFNLIAAKLLLWSQDHQWDALPDSSLFDFVFELARRLEGRSLLKEMSHLGALRATEEEVHKAVRDKRLTQYYGYTAWVDSKAYSRLTFDPCNQIYAA